MPLRCHKNPLNQTQTGMHPMLRAVHKRDIRLSAVLVTFRLDVLTLILTTWSPTTCIQDDSNPMAGSDNFPCGKTNLL